MRDKPSNIRINDRPVYASEFSGGEVHVNIVEHTDPIEQITAVLKSSLDVMALVMTTSAICHHYSEKDLRDINLLVPYFPYARQDRVCNPGEAHGARAMARIINSLGYGSVTVFDPHSDVTPALLVKATAGAVSGRFQKIYKDPVTDDGTKKSLTGMINVQRAEDGQLHAIDELSYQDETSLLRTVFKDGMYYGDENLGDIRKRVEESL